MQRGGNRYDNKGGYNSRNNYGQRQQQQSVQSPWQPDAPQELNELNMQLEMVKRKRQMLQEQRQLLEEQQQLEQLQGQRNASPWDNQPNRQFNNQPQQNYNLYTNYANRYDRAPAGEQRGYKRPAKPSPWQDQSQPKRFAPAPAPKAFVPNKGPGASPRAPFPRQQRNANSQLDREVGPAQPPAGVYRGEEASSRSAKYKINTAVGFIIREMKDQYFCPPHNIMLLNFQFLTMKRRITERVQKLLMNKPMGTPTEIHQLYRITHSAKGDLRLLQAMLALTEDNCNLSSTTKAPAPTKPAQAPKPKNVAKKTVAREPIAKDSNEQVAAQVYMKENFNKALEAKLTEIFEKVHKIYADESPEKKPAEDSNKSDEPETAAKAENSAETETALKAEANKECVEDSNGAEKKELSKEEEAYEALLDQLLRHKLPHVLPRYKGYIRSIIARDPAFSKFDIKPEAKPAPSESLKFVKIFGRPSLPPRAAMQTFLYQFEPASIKKHKSIYNLLFVGVPGSKYDLLLEQNGHTIGNKSLDILAAPQDWTNKNQQNKSNEKNVVKTGAAETDDPKAPESLTEGQVVTTQNGDSEKGNLEEAMASLDNEIDELLTSVKESEDADNAENDNATVENDNATAAETGNGVEKSKENIAETANDDAEKDPENTGNVEIGESVEETGKQVEEKNENGDKVEEVKAPDTPASAIQTRRSSRLPQKN